MNQNNRHGNKWTINETLSLQREYELLEWNVYEIAEKHERSVMAIMSKLHNEGFINNWNEARGFKIEEYCDIIHDIEHEVDNEEKDNEDYQEEHEEEEDDEDYYEEDEDYVPDDDYNEELESNVNQLTQRVWSLETSVSEIGSMVKHIFNIFRSKPEQHQTSNI